MRCDPTPTRPHPAPAHISGMIPALVAIMPTSRQDGTRGAAAGGARHEEKR